MKAINIIKKLKENNFESYIVGGAVRNSILGIPNEDEDIVTNATPDEIEEVFSGYKVDTVGKSFLVTIVEGVDIATYRLDHYNHTGHCKPIQATTLKEDLARRDLTINAVAFCPISNTYIDPFNGLGDLRDGIISFVGNAEERIKEDPCRLLRAFRFDALLNNKRTADIEINDLITMQENKEMIREVAPERIQNEIIKVLRTCDKPSIFFTSLFDSGILEIILPELSNCFGFDGGKYHRETVDEHLLSVCDNLPKDNIPLRLAGLFHDIAKPVVCDEDGRFIEHDIKSAEITRKILKRLKFSNKIIDNCCNIIVLHMQNIDFDMKPKKIRKLLKKCYDLKVNPFDLLQHKVADRNANGKHENYGPKEINRLIAMLMNERMNSNLVLSPKDLKVDGNDMKDIGYSGPEISEVLNYLVKICIAVPENNNRERLMVHAIGGRKKDLTEDEFLELRKRYKNPLSNILENTVDLSTDFAQVIEDNFWDLT